MKNLKTMTLLASLCVGSFSFAQQQLVKMKTAMAVGSEMTFMVNGTASGVKVDWGDGVYQEHHLSVPGSPLFEIKGKVKGEHVNISCDDNLIFLDVDKCALTELELLKARGLQSLSCADNELTSLDLRQMHQLYDLDCSHNQLVALTFSSADYNKVANDMPVLENMDISHNLFEGAYRFTLPTLRSLNISSNKFNRLYIYDKSLELLNCSNNQIDKGLYLMKLENLQGLLCFNNNISSLSFSNSGQKVQQLFCDGNKIRQIILSEAEELKDLSCADNELTLVGMPEKSELSSLNVSGNNLDFSVLPQKNKAPEYLEFLPQSPFDFQRVEGILYKDGIAYVPLSESWSDRQYINLKSKGSLANGRNDATLSWYAIEDDGSQRELTRRKTSAGTEDFYLSQGKVAFFTPHKKAYVKLTSHSYGYTLQSVPIAIGDDVTAVERPCAVDGSLQISVANEALRLSGKGNVHVFTPAGKCVWQGFVNGETLVNLPKGIYIVNNVKIVL